MGFRYEAIALVTRDTRYKGLLKAKATAGAILFALGSHRKRERLRRELSDEVRCLSMDACIDLEAADVAADAAEYEDEDRVRNEAARHMMKELDFGLPVVPVDRDHVPTFDFERCLAVVVVGPDGLVANVAKYVGGVPIIGVNPDPKRNDGVLLPFTVDNARAAVKKTIDRRAKVRPVTLAQVSLSDGQELLAFNDLFVGTRSHTSARYSIRADEGIEVQSSSGIIVSTGAGSTGWLSSVWNMIGGAAAACGGAFVRPPDIAWEDRRLAWVVREPFRSRHSDADVVCGSIEEGSQLVLESLMPENGVIFSDGVERDYLEFTSGTIARIGVSDQRANLVVG